MAWFEEYSDMGAVGDRAAKAWRVPMGVASPLWLAFGAAASAGVAYWWLTRWTRAVNVEALADLALAPLDLQPEPDPVAAPLAETAAAPSVAPEPAAAPAPEPVIAPIAEAAPVEAAPAKVAPKKPQPPAPDDLTLMNGIGPKLSEALAARGVTRFAQIAAWKAEELADIDKALSLKGRAVREAWVAQAKRLAKEL